MGRQHEVAIVGAGPAGSVLALLLARRGVDVLLLERVRHPRPKPCGDCLSAEATRLLEQLGLLEAVLARAPAALRGWRIFAPRGARFEQCFDGMDGTGPDRHALALPRSELDHVLFEAAAAAGANTLTDAAVTDLRFDADVVTGVRVRRDHDEFTVGARLVVGADGLRSRVARRLGAVSRPARTRKLSLTARCPLDLRLGGFGEMHSGEGVCLGLAPVSADHQLHNLTLVADADRFGREVAADPPAFFARAVASLPAARAALPAGAELMASGPFDVPVRRVAFDGACLVGDAAGYFDPFTGQGVYHAMAGAERLAPIIDRALRQHPHTLRAGDLAGWTRAHHALGAGMRRVQRIIDAVLARPGFAEAAITLLDRRPAAARRLLAVTADLQPARSLLTSGFALSLLTPRTRNTR